MTDQQSQATVSDSAVSDSAVSDSAVSDSAVSDSAVGEGTELSLAELESQITQAEALVEDLNRRLEQTADDGL